MIYYKNKGQKDLTLNEASECIELIGDLQKVSHKYSTCGCIAFDNFNELIPDDLYKFACYMSTNAIHAHMIQFVHLETRL